MAPEIVLGRMLAFCAHPRLAWPVLSVGGRVVLVGAYFAAAYTSMFVALLVFGR